MIAARLFAATAFALFSMAAPQVRAEGPTAVAQGAAPFSTARLANIEKYLNADIAKGLYPGATITIVKDGKVAHQKFFGVRDAATKLPMTPDTIFRIYSMTKPITTVAAMMLVEEGRLSLEEPVAKYIPAFKDVKVGVEKPDANGKPALELVPPRRPMTI